MYYKINVIAMLNEQEIKELLKRMSESDKDILIDLINKERVKATNNDDLLKLQNNYRCPYCQSTKINKNETAYKNLPQFICRNCKLIFLVKL